MLWDREMKFSSYLWVWFGEIWVEAPAARPVCLPSQSRLLALEVDMLAKSLSRLWLFW